MRKIFLLLVLLSLLFGLVACNGGSSVEYTVVEKDKQDEQKSTIRIYTESTDEEDLKEIVEDIKTNELFGAVSIHAWIHEPPEDGEEFGEIFATGKYANTSQGAAQVGVDEIGKAYIEFE